MCHQEILKNVTFLICSSFLGVRKHSWLLLFSQVRMWHRHILCSMNVGQHPAVCQWVFVTKALDNGATAQQSHLHYCFWCSLLLGARRGWGGWYGLIDIKTHAHSHRCVCVCVYCTNICNNVKWIEDEVTWRLMGIVLCLFVWAVVDARL